MAQFLGMKVADPLLLQLFVADDKDNSGLISWSEFSGPKGSNPNDPSTPFVGSFGLGLGLGGEDQSLLTEVPFLAVVLCISAAAYMVFSRRCKTSKMCPAI